MGERLVRDPAPGHLLRLEEEVKKEGDEKTTDAGEAEEVEEYNSAFRKMSASDDTDDVGDEFIEDASWAHSEEPDSSGFDSTVRRPDATSRLSSIPTASPPTLSILNSLTSDEVDFFRANDPAYLDRIQTDFLTAIKVDAESGESNTTLIELKFLDKIATRQLDLEIASAAEFFHPLTDTPWRRKVTFGARIEGIIRRQQEFMREHNEYYHDNGGPGRVEILKNKIKEIKKTTEKFNKSIARLKWELDYLQAERRRDYKKTTQMRRDFFEAMPEDARLELRQLTGELLQSFDRVAPERTLSEGQLKERSRLISKTLGRYILDTNMQGRFDKRFSGKTTRGFAPDYVHTPAGEEGRAYAELPTDIHIEPKFLEKLVRVYEKAMKRTA